MFIILKYLDLAHESCGTKILTKLGYDLILKNLISMSLTLFSNKKFIILLHNMIKNYVLKL